MAEALTGRKLSEAAYLLASHRDLTHSGFEVADLARELELTGVRIAGDDPVMTLRSALNADQARWVNRGDGLWIWILEKRPVGTELSGRALADVIYQFVQSRYTTDRGFHYEIAKDAMLKTGVRIKGSATGPTMRSALVGSPDRFEPMPSRGRGWWRWKEPQTRA